MANDRETLNTLDQGREAYHRHAWEEAYAALSAADRAEPLGPDDLELLATAAYLTGRNLDYRTLLERAHHTDLARGDQVRAARSAFWLGLTALLQGDVGLATGWLSRSRRLTESLDCAQQGYLLVTEAEERLARRDASGAHDVASRAAAIGERHRDADLIACARHLQGRALIHDGQVKGGLVLLDEAMLAAIAGELSPIMTGLLYCSVIEACQRVHAVSRAREWTSALSQWCEQQPEMVAFTGTCLVHRAEILQFHGAWPDAMTEASRACERSERAKRKPPGAAYYQQAEIHRLRGEFAAAEAAYRAASGLGCEPQPGLALLRMAEGRIDASCAAIRRVVSGATDPLQRAKLLPSYIDILLAAGEIDEADRVCTELDGIAEDLDTEVLGTQAAHSRGAVALARGDAAAAVGPLRRAFEGWQRAESPYAAARARAALGMACRALGDDETAELDLAGARAVLEHLGAAPDLARLDVVQKARPSTLTTRELQVLRRIAAGKTNKSIAAELSVSERTVDRHVSNILTKLGVASRAAATAHAYDHKLLG